MRAIICTAVLGLIAASTVSATSLRFPFEGQRLGNGSDTCVGNVTAALGELADFKTGLVKAIAQCANKSAPANACGDLITGLVTDVNEAAKDISMAVGACGDKSHGEKCANDLLELTTSLSKFSADLYGAVESCKKGPTHNLIKCLIDIAGLGVEIDHVVKAARGAKADCSKKTPTTGLRFAMMESHRLGNGSDTCVGNVTAALGELADFKNGVVKAVADCKNKSAPVTACADDITGAVTDIAEAAKDISMAVGACGDKTHSDKCANEVLMIATALSKTSGDLYGAIESCRKGTTHNLGKCLIDIAALGVEVDHIVKDIEGAVKDCKKQ